MFPAANALQVSPMAVFPTASTLSSPMRVHAQNLRYQFCNRRGSHLRLNPKHPTLLKISDSFAPCSISSVPRKNVKVALHCFGLKTEYEGPHHNFHNRLKLLRDVVARSELAGTGMPDARNQLSAPKMSSRVRGVLFYVVTAVSAIFLIVLMLVAHPFVLLFDRYQRKAHHFVAKIWATSSVIPFFSIEIEGLDNLPKPDTPAVYVSNHQSFLDIYTLLTLGRSFKFISKTGIFLFPVIGWAMFMLGIIPLKRVDTRSQLECLKRCMDLIEKGASVFFFPEGTRSKDGKLGAFKKGAFSVAVKTGVPVVPITLVGTGKIMPAGMEGIINPGSVKVLIHEPMEGTDPDVLCKEAREKIAKHLRC